MTVPFKMSRQVTEPVTEPGAVPGNIQGRPERRRGGYRHRGSQYRNMGRRGHRRVPASAGGGGGGGEGGGGGGGGGVKDSLVQAQEPMPGQIPVQGPVPPRGGSRYRYRYPYLTSAKQSGKRFSRYRYKRRYRQGGEPGIDTGPL